ncbi:hypothetical protein [Roseibium sp.]|uniref:hypothetical protein n=1 Tax=Roseibium sp. TaxID=1936156 RepID=UPI003BB13F2B
MGFRNVSVFEATRLFIDPFSEKAVLHMIRFLLLCFLFLSLSVAASSANNWIEADLPAYADDTEFVAIGTDGLLYSVSANPNGYVFTSLQDAYRFEPSGDGFTGRILSARKVYYLGASCDAAGEGLTGSWTVNGTGLAFAISGPAGVLQSFHLLSTGLTPNHSC